MAANRSATPKPDAAPTRIKHRQLTALPSYFSEPEAEDFSRLIYERIRLGIMSALLANRTLSFAELKHLLKTSDGNLSVHARKLEEAGYLDCKKTFTGRLPKTEYQLTPQGRKVFVRYLNHMEALIRIARNE